MTVKKLVALFSPFISICILLSGGCAAEETQTRNVATAGATEPATFAPVNNIVPDVTHLLPPRISGYPRSWLQTMLPPLWPI